MATTSQWIAGARPRTLWTAVAPVLVGTSAAAVLEEAHLGLAVLALVTALGLQVASNYANDYADGVRGTDVDRVGPTRLTASGLARPSHVREAALWATLVGIAAGAALCVLSGQWWLLAVGAVAVGAAWTYTASANPYGYRGLGEIAVFVFFGPIAVLGTTFTQAGRIEWWVIAASSGVGLYAVALLMVNNIRDRAGDAAAGKNTLVVQLGERPSRMVFAFVVMGPVLAAFAVAFVRPWVLGSVVVALPSLLAALAVLAGASGPALKPIFGSLMWIGGAYAILLSIGILL